MPLLDGVALDPTAPGPLPTVTAATGALYAPDPPPPPPPADGDPDAPPPVPLPALPWTEPGAVVQVLVQRVVTLELVGELVTAVVEDWDEDVDFLTSVSALLTAAVDEPLWEAMAHTSWVGSDGRTHHEWDPGRYVFTICVDGVRVWTGLPQAPTDWDGERVVIRVSGPAAVFDPRILGRGEQLDVLGGRGSFEPGTASGWVADAGVTMEVVNASEVPGGVVRGTRCLRVRGDGWVRSPVATLVGQEGVSQAVVASVFGRWAASVPEGTPVVVCTVSVDGVQVNGELSFTEAGLRPATDARWSDDPLPAACRLTPRAVTHTVWVAMRSFAGIDTFYDEATIRQPVLSGSLIQRDLSWYAARAVTNLHSRSLGGAPTGLRVDAVDCGTTAQKTWSHSRHPTARDVFAWILEQPGAPEIRVTPAWTMQVRPRIGARRTNVVLSMDQVLSPAWAIDAGARANEIKADTGRGDGVTWVSATVTGDLAPDELRSTRMVVAPDGWSLNDSDRWALRHHRLGARQQLTGTVEVAWADAGQFGLGDTVQMVQEAGTSGAARVVRILNRRFFPGRGAVALTFGLED